MTTALKPTPRRPLLIAIAGGSASGKSYLAEQIARALPRKVARFSLDDFYFDRSHLSAERRARINFDHPRAIDWKSIVRAVESLRSGHPAQIPCYDFTTHCRRLDRKEIVPRPYVVVEGLWPFYSPKLRRLFDLCVYLECDARTRLQRRMARDLATRGRTKSSIRVQFQTAVEPMHRRHVAPQAERADIVLRQTWGKTEVQFLVASMRVLARVDPKRELRTG